MTTDLDRHLADLGPEPNVETAARLAVERYRGVVDSGHERDYVSLAPKGGYIGLYVHATEVSIALPAAESASASAAISGSDVERKNQTTHYIHVPDGAIAADFDAVVGLMVRSLEWRAGTSAG